MKKQPKRLTREQAMNLIDRRYIAAEDRVKLFNTIRTGDVKLALDLFSILLSAKLDWNLELEDPELEV